MTALQPLNIFLWQHDHHSHECYDAVQVMNTFIEQHGSPGGAYLLGSNYSYAEVAASPFLHRALVLLPEFRGYSLETALQQQNLPRLQAWIKVSNSVTPPQP